MAALEDPDTVRAVLGACARRLDGTPAAATTTRRKRAVFANALGYAVERRLLPANPLDQIQWKAAEVAETVDRRSVASPAQAARLLAAVRAARPARRAHGSVLRLPVLRRAAARPRPSRSANADCVLPDSGWGRIDLAASAPRAGTEWTDDGASRQERGLKHRAAGETRSIPIPPALVELLRDHLKRYGTGPDGRLFRTARGGPLNDTGYGEVWQRARPLALTPAQQAIPAGPPPLRPAARRRVAVAQRRRARHRGRPPRRPRRRRPAQGLRQLHRRPGRRRQPAHRRRPRRARQRLTSRRKPESASLAARNRS